MAERFYRANSRGLIAGVAAGLAAYFGVHPVWVRLAFVLAALASNLTVVVYVMLWLLLPERSEMVTPSRDRMLEQNIHQVQAEAREWAQDLLRVFDRDAAIGSRESDHAVLLGGLLMLLGLASLADSVELLGPFRLVHLWPVVLCLMGWLALHRARGIY